jgi:EmrB/QacA subfamily drug resistance transporter
MSAEALPGQELATAEKPSRVRWWALVIACVATFMLMLDVTVVNVALPDIRRSFQADFSGLQWVIDTYTLTLAAFLLTAGSVADRIGRKRVFCAGLVVFTLASLSAGAAPDVLALNISRCVQGTGAAVLFAVGPALIAQEFSGRERGSAYGIFGAVTGLALAFGPALGGLLASANWRWIFLVNVPIGIILLVLSVLRLREVRHPAGRGVDWPGVVIFGAALVLLVLGFLRGEVVGWGSPAIVTMFVVGVVLLVLFTALERRRGDAAMLDLSLFRKVTFVGISVATFLSNATSLAAIFIELSYLQNVLGYSPLGAGLRLLPLTLVLFVVAAITGGIVTKVAPGRLIGLAILFIAIGMGLIALIGPASSWIALLPSMIVMGIGMGLFNPPRSVISVGVAEPAKAGMATGIGETFQQVGVAIGVAGFGALFQDLVQSKYSGSPQGAAVGRRVAAGYIHQVPGGAEAARAAFVHGFTVVAVICAIVCAVGALVAFTFIRQRDLHESAQME